MGHTFLDSAISNRFADSSTLQQHHNLPIVCGNSISQYENGFRQSSDMGPPPSRRGSENQAWNGYNRGQENLHRLYLYAVHIFLVDFKLGGRVSTPSSHRQPVPLGPSSSVGLNFSNLEHRQQFSTPQPQNLDATSSRHPLSNISPNLNSNQPGFAGYGLSGGMKISRPAGAQSVNTNLSRPIIRSRGMYLV